MMTEKKIYVLTEDVQLRDRWLAVIEASEATTATQLSALTDVIVIVDIDTPHFTHDQPLWKFAKSVKMIAATATPNDDMGILYLDQGAVGLMHTYSDAEVISQVLSVVAAGELWVGRTLLQRLLRGVARLPVSREQFKHASLTERENEVARLVAKGNSNKEIANALTITERTVKAHVSTILDKLNVEDRLQLALKVNGIT